MRRRAADIETDDAVVPDPEDQDLGGLVRPALGHVLDDPEGVEEGIDDVDDEQKKAGRRQQRKGDPPEPAARAGAVEGGGFEQGFRDRLQSGEKEQKIVADLLPGGGEDHQQQGLAAVEQKIPVDADARRSAEPTMPKLGLNRNSHSTPAIAGAIA